MSKAQQKMDEDIAKMKRELKLPEGTVSLPDITSKLKICCLFDVSASNVFEASTCDESCDYCCGTNPIQVCSLSYILNQEVLPPLDISNLISGAWGAPSAGWEQMGILEFYKLCSLYSKNPYNQDRFGTNLFYLKQMLEEIKTKKNVHLVIYTDGQIADNEKQAFLSLVNTIKLSNVIKITLIFPKYTKPNDINEITSSWSNILRRNTQPIIFEHIVQNTGIELYSIIDTMTKEEIPVTPKGYKNLFGLFIYHDNSTLQEIVTFLKEHPEIAAKLEEIILNIMNLNPSLFVGDDANIYSFTHRILIRLQEDKKYFDKVSSLNSKWTSALKAKNAEITLSKSHTPTLKIELEELKNQCDALKALLDSTRVNETNSLEIVNILLPNMTGILVFKQLCASLTKKNVVASLAVGSGADLITLMKELFRIYKDGSDVCMKFMKCPEGVTKLGHVIDELGNTHYGMLVLDDRKATSRECLNTLCTFFRGIDPNIVPSRSKAIIILMCILSSSAKLPEEFMTMIFKIFEDVTIVNEIFGISEDGKTINLDDSKFSKLCAEVFFNAIYNYKDIIFKHVNKETKEKIITYITNIRYSYNIFYILKKLMKEYPKQVPIEYESQNGLDAVIGSLVLLKSHVGDPKKQLPSCGLVLDCTKTSVLIVYLERPNFNDITGLPDTHNCKPDAILEVLTGPLIDVVGQCNPTTRDLSFIQMFALRYCKKHPLLTSTNTKKPKTEELQQCNCYDLLTTDISVNSFKPKKSISIDHLRIIMALLRTTHPDHTLLQVHDYLCSLDEQYDKDGPSLMKNREYYEEVIRNMCSVSKTSRTNSTAFVSSLDLINYLTAKFGLSTTMAQMLREGSHLNRAVMETFMDGTDSKQPVLRQISFKDSTSNNRTINPDDDDTVFSSLYKEAQEKLSKLNTKRIGKPSVLEIISCCICRDDSREFIISSCNHVICTDCQKYQATLLRKARDFQITFGDDDEYPGYEEEQERTEQKEKKSVNNSWCKCYCGVFQPTEIPELNDLIKKGIEANDAIRFCATNGCKNPYIVQTSCSGIDNISMYCTSCTEARKPQIDSSRSREFVLCPGCDVATERIGEFDCDFMTCSQCSTEFCYGCSYIFPRGEVFDWECTCLEPGTSGFAREYNPINEDDTCENKLYNQDPNDYY